MVLWVVAFILTANATDTGEVVYRMASHHWTRRIAEAAAVESSESDALLARARTEQAAVCDPYVVEVDLTDAGPRPRSLRERIRADGPTIPYR